MKDPYSQRTLGQMTSDLSREPDIRKNNRLDSDTMQIMIRQRIRTYISFGEKKSKDAFTFVVRFQVLVSIISVRIPEKSASSMMTIKRSVNVPLV